MNDWEHKVTITSHFHEVSEWELNICYLTDLTSSGKYGLFKNDCSNFGVLGLLKKKKNWYFLSLWKVFFLQLADLHVVQSSRLLTLLYKKYSTVQFVHTTWIPIPHQICALSDHPNSHTKENSTLWNVHFTRKQPWCLYLSTWDPMHIELHDWSLLLKLGEDPSGSLLFPSAR